MKSYYVKVGNTTIAIDATEMSIVPNGRRFEILDAKGEHFICSVEVWGEHTCTDSDGNHVEPAKDNAAAAIQSESCDTAQ